MSRSRRHTPIMGNCAETDAPFKATEHRRERRAAKVAVGHGDEPPAPKRYGNPWNSAKDGKGRFDARRFPEAMRK